MDAIEKAGSLTSVPAHEKILERLCRTGVVQARWTGGCGWAPGLLGGSPRFMGHTSFFRQVLSGQLLPVASSGHPRTGPVYPR